MRHVTLPWRRDLAHRYAKCDAPWRVSCGQSAVWARDATSPRASRTVTSGLALEVTRPTRQSGGVVRVAVTTAVVAGQASGIVSYPVL